MSIETVEVAVEGLRTQVEGLGSSVADLTVVATAKVAVFDAKIAEVTDLITQLPENPVGVSPAELAAAVDPKADTTAVNAALALKADAEATTAALGGKASTDSLNAAVAQLQAAIDAIPDGGVGSEELEAALEEMNFIKAAAVADNLASVAQVLAIAVELRQQQ